MQQAPLISWDTQALIEAEVGWRRENLEGERDEDDLFMDAAREDELFRDVAWDADFFRREWEGLCDYLTELMGQRGMTTHLLRCTVENFGWRHLDGEKVFWAETGSDLLQKILPETDCTFYIYGDEDGLRIQNFHHDSPMGKEIYLVVPVETEIVVPVPSLETINAILDAVEPLEEFDGASVQPNAVLLQFTGEGATHGELQVINGDTGGWHGPHVRVALCDDEKELDWVLDDWLAEEYYLIGRGVEYTIKMKEV